MNVFLAEYRCSETRLAHAGRDRASRRGFTLVEVLVVTVLAAVLMSGLWAILSTYERLFTRGQARMERARLLAAVSERIRSDLENAIPDMPTTMPGAGASVRRFGLFGTSQSLQVDVLQVDESQIYVVAEQDALANAGPMSTSESDAGPKASELRTIRYGVKRPPAGETRFKADAGSARVEANAEPSGLFRRELDWDTPIGGKGGAGSPRATSRMADSDSGVGRRGGGKVGGGRRAAIAVAESTENASEETLDPNDPGTFSAPEIADVRFRYYDGSGWSQEWNSLTRRSLPVAVEVTLTLAEETDDRAARLAKASQSVAESNLVETPGESAGEKHTFVVFPPSTALAKPTDSQGASGRGKSFLRPSRMGAMSAGAPSSMALPVPPSPSAFAPSGNSPNSPQSPGSEADGQPLPGEAMPVRASDQWMRSGR